MAIKKEILDELLKDRDPKTMFSSDGLLGELKKAFAERVLNAEMDRGGSACLDRFLFGISGSA